LVQEILTTGARRFEEAVRDAQARGDISGSDAALKGRMVWAFYEGTLTRARIDNNPELLHNLFNDILELIGARRPAGVLA
jgi:TetR/AcrR family transcriptional repressor of nem operon